MKKPAMFQVDHLSVVGESGDDVKYVGEVEIGPSEAVPWSRVAGSTWGGMF